MYVADFGAKGSIDINITSRSRTNDIGKWSIYNIVWRKVDLDAVNLIHSLSMLIKNYGFLFYSFYNIKLNHFMIQTALKSMNVIHFPLWDSLILLTECFKMFVFFSLFLGVDLNQLHWQLLWQTRSETVFGPHHKPPPLTRLSTLKWLYEFDTINSEALLFKETFYKYFENCQILNGMINLSYFVVICIRTPELNIAWIQLFRHIRLLNKCL